MSWAIQYAIAFGRSIRPATRMPNVTAGFTSSTEMLPKRRR